MRRALLEAARDETDRLAWCEQRVRELGERTSLLAPVWYAGSFAIGTLAGLAGDRTSLGFVAETERQVVNHLDEHLTRIAPHDHKSRAILEQMKIDELHHGTTALEAGGEQLPSPVKKLMQAMSKVMTGTTYWI